MRGEIVHEIKELRLFRLEFNVLSENGNERFAGMVFSTSAKDLAGFHLEKRQEVCRPVPGVIITFVTGLSPGGRHGWVFPLQSLKVRAFVKEEEMLRRIEKKRKKSFHLWEEIRVPDLKEVLVAVRRQNMTLEDSLNGGPAGRAIEDFGILQVLLCRSEVPGATAGKGRTLAVKRNDSISRRSIDDGGPAGPRTVGQSAAFVPMISPAIDGRNVAVDKPGNDRSLHVLLR